jgi:formylglycine-generating enzyme required for sulfatase activity
MRHVCAGRFASICVVLGAGLCHYAALAQSPATPSVHDGQPRNTTPASPGSSFQDCLKECPTMIGIPAGSFTMGTGGTGSEWMPIGRPLHKVAIAKPFAVSKFEVTFAQWDACVAAAACPRVRDRWGRGQMPVINVTWESAKQYVRWLSLLTGEEYRLLSEAEWEYAARAGSTTNYAWGDDIGKNNANCADCGSQWDEKQTAEVGSFKPNALGLYDMHGNVWEWVEDSWHDDFRGAPPDGTAWVDGDTTFRVIRGGSWVAESEFARSDTRVERKIYVEFGTLGFRVARTLDP